MKIRWCLIVVEHRHCGRLTRGIQNEIFSHIKGILGGLGKFPFCSLPNVPSGKGVLSILSGKEKQPARTVRKLFVGLLRIFHEDLSALSI